jgi:hypothetical protein
MGRLAGSAAGLVARSCSESLLDSTDDSEHASSPEPSSKLLTFMYGLGRQRYVELWSESGAQLLVFSTATGNLSRDTIEGFLLLLPVRSGSVMGGCMSLSLLCCGIQC